LEGLRLFFRCKLFQERRNAFRFGGVEAIFMTKIPIKSNPLQVEVPRGSGDFVLGEFSVVILNQIRRGRPLIVGIWFVFNCPF
jgi:hypothetical protein